MSRVAFLVVLVLAFVAGLTLNPREGAAANPPPCPKYECKTFHAYWSGNGSDKVWAYHAATVAPNIGAPDVNAGPIPIFTDTSKEKLPLINLDTVDKFAYTTCVPLCGLDPTNGKWQAEQEVTRGAVRNQNFVSRGLAHKKCTATENNAEGPHAENQNNQSDPGTPPGVMTEIPPGP